MLRSIIPIIVALLFLACATTATDSADQPEAVVATVPEVPSSPAASVSVPEPEVSAKASKAPLKLLTWDEYTEALFRVLGTYSFKEQGTSFIQVTVYDRSLLEASLNIWMGGEMSPSLMGHPVKQYTVKRSSSGSFGVAEGVVLKHKRISEPPEPPEMMVCVSPERLGGMPPKGHECCLIGQGGEHSWLGKVDAKAACHQIFNW